MSPRHFQNLSANTVQLLVNQLCGLVIFYLLSTQLTKSDFGQINLVLAILLVLFSLLSLGIDQVIIRKIAMGHEVIRVSAIYLSHVLTSGLLFYLVLLLCSTFIPLSTNLYPLLLFIGAGKLMIYFSTPFKQIASGLEQFRSVAYMLVVSNLVRSSGLVILSLLDQITLRGTIIIFILGDVMELLFCIYHFRYKLRIPVVIRWNTTGYKQLLREALPQTGVVIITAAIARFDWIFIGIMASSIKLAEYSFAYKVFELATLPLLAIAPLLLPWFTRLLKNGLIDNGRLKFILRTEFIIAGVTGLILNILWIPVVDHLTAGKYGAVNAYTIFILSLCIPFLYLNNFLWSIYFSQNQLRMILTGFIITFSVNAGLNLILIPYFQNEGAAVAFLAASVTQTYYYLRQNRLPELRTVWQDLSICMGCTLISGFAAKTCFTNHYIILLSALILCFGLLIITGRISIKDRLILHTIFNR